MWLSVLLSRNGFKCMFKGSSELAFNSCRGTWKTFPRDEGGFTVVFSLPPRTKVNHSGGNQDLHLLVTLKTSQEKQSCSGYDNCRDQRKAEFKLQPREFSCHSTSSSSLRCAHRHWKPRRRCENRVSDLEPTSEAILSRRWVPVLISSAFCWRAALAGERSLFW